MSDPYRRDRPAPFRAPPVTFAGAFAACLLAQFVFVVIAAALWLALWPLFRR